MPMLTVFGDAEPKPIRQDDPYAPKVFGKIPPLRPSLFERHEDDAQRVDYQKRLWTSQDYLLRGRDRQVEENIRMLCGQHWSIWSEALGRHVDLTRYFTDEEKRWRQMPVMNRLLMWFMMLHGRMTENPPVITFQPATSDRADSELAEVMDTVWKTLWHQTDMTEVIDDLVAWLIPGGRAYLKSWIDPDAGDFVPYQAEGMLSLLSPDGEPILGADGLPIERYLDTAPYGLDGRPLSATIDTNGDLILPSPYMGREGAIRCGALSCLEVRGQWGPYKWRHKDWHHHRTYCTPEQVFKAFGVDLEPEIFGEDAESIAEFQRLHFGAGYYGQAGGREEVAGTSSAAKEGFIEIIEGWYKPSDFPGMERTEDSPGGRLLITTRNHCLRDGARYAPFPHTSPIHSFDFVNIPGRPQGTSPQEMMNGPARSRNRFYAQVFQHTSLVANPIKMVDKATGLQPGDVPNKPGAEVFANFQGMSGDPIRYTRPPDLGTDIYKVLDLLTREHDDLGNIPGAEGRPPTRSPSGQLIRELRFNSDRFVAATARRLVVGIARVVEDWQVMLPLIWPDGKLLKVGGDENVAQTIMAAPELFRLGRINVVPDLESMLPEGRDERAERYWAWYQAGVLGQPGSPEATNLFLDLVHFPHLNREAMPGGVDRSTADTENGQLLVGAMPPVLEWYDHAVHLHVHYRFMKSQQYLKLAIPIQQGFLDHVRQHEEMQQLLAMQAMQREIDMRRHMAPEEPEPEPEAGPPA